MSNTRRRFSFRTDYTLVIPIMFSFSQDQQITDVLKENQKLKKMNAKLISICKKRGKEHLDEQRENNPTEG